MMKEVIETRQMLIIALALCWLLGQSNAFVIYRVQGVAVKGVIQCAGRPLPDVHIKLVDDDEPDPDDVMAFGFTSENGSFFLEGHESEMTNIDPVLEIFHKCNDKGIPCERLWRIVIPKKYISDGDGRPSKVMNLGVMNAEVVLNGETRSCDH